MFCCSIVTIAYCRALSLAHWQCLIAYMACLPAYPPQRIHNWASYMHAVSACLQPFTCFACLPAYSPHCNRSTTAPPACCPTLSVLEHHDWRIDNA
jgi:hypothetical protein